MSFSFSGAYSMENNAAHNEYILKPIVEHAKLIVQEKESKELPFIAIAGCSAVGKSYLTTELVKLLTQEGIKVAILKMDDFINPDHFDPNHFHPWLEHTLAHEVIQKIKKGEKSVKMPAWNPKHLRPPAKIEKDFSVEGVDLIVFEGEFTLCVDAPYDFSKYSTMSVFIDAKDEDILEWGWQRKERTIVEKTKEEFVKNNKPSLQKYRAHFFVQRAATYVVLKDLRHHYSLQVQ